jgi:murein DD-endopeptidase MepM/ murein hydrolase activator NlpD
MVADPLLKLFIGLGIVALMLVGAAAVDYFGLLLQANENKRLRADNLALKRQFQVVEGKLNSLETSLERVQNFSKKLKLITNIDDEDRSVKLTMGANPKPGQGIQDGTEPVEERGPASEIFSKDSLFMQRPPLDDLKGELSVDTKKDYATLSIRIDRAVKETQLREQSILQLWEGLSERQSLLSSTPSIKPARGWFTSRFGYRVDPFNGKAIMHAGIDIAGPPGTPVYAPADGVVSYAGFEEGYGKLVSIDHGYGVVTRFGHNSRVFVTLGQKVKRKDVIAAIGSTGHSTGPHVHYEVRIHGVPVDPINYILDE